MQPVYITAEQAAFHEEMKRLVEKAYANDGALRGEPAVIGQARHMLDRAVALKLPSPMLVEMQILISGYENQERLPAHLRADWFRAADQGSK